MRKKRIFFNGCSFTADCGFSEDNQQKYHWPWKLADHYQSYFYNAAIGGSSNEEIFYRTVESCRSTKYDLAVIMWSGIGRKWVYFSDNNVDDFTIMNQGVIKGFYKHRSSINDYSKLHYSYFNNRYVDIKRWLLQIVSLEQLFSSKKQPYVFAKGFDNLVNEIAKITYSVKDGFVGMNDELKAIFDFDQRPDYYINTKLEILQGLIQEVKKYNWVNFDDLGFCKQACDVADDLSHPGITSNQNFANNLISYCDLKGLMVSGITRP